MAETETLRPGSTHVFTPGKSLVVGLGVWPQKQAGKIHIHMTGRDDFHTTVTNDPESARYHHHRTLFRNLRRLLIEHGVWPYGDDGSETEDQ
jgi:hypothetical protein